MNLLAITNGRIGDGFTWQPTAVSRSAHESENEVVFDEPNFLNIWWLDKAINAARSVARIKFLSGGSATGFLVGSDILMTNNHVFEKENDAKNSIVQFNFRLVDEEAIAKKDEWECDPDALFKTDKNLDYSIVKLKTKAGKKAGDVWGVINPHHNSRIVNGVRVNLIQHPKGRWQEIAFRDNYVRAVTDTKVQYITDTDYGSSGSPVFDDYFKLVGLHSQRVKDPVTDTWYRNQGFRIDKIVENAGGLIP